MSYQTVVLYSQSGAGKSSLVRAGLGPALVGQRVRLLPVARVGGDYETDTTGGNIYVRNALSTLLGSKANLNDSLSGNLVRKSVEANNQRPRPRVIVFDQFEELFTAYPDRWREREGFFIQLKGALEEDVELRALFVIREERLAELDAYSELVPLGFRIRYRLERLQEDAALIAIQQPLQEFGYRIKDIEAKRLIANLRQIKVRVRRSIKEAEGQYVEPVHLQVVCQHIWRRHDKEQEVVSVPDEVVDIDQALASYYEQAVKHAASQGPVGEAKIRRWFERELITPRGTRGLVFKGETFTEGLPNHTLDLLEEDHVVRQEPRGTDSWYELTHDRFVAPIKHSNALWQRRWRLRNWTLYGLGIFVCIAVVVGLLSQLYKTREERRANAAVLQGDVELARKHWYDALQQYRQALHLYARAERLDLKGLLHVGDSAPGRSYTEIYTSVGEAYVQLHDSERAAAFFSRVLQLDTLNSALNALQLDIPDHALQSVDAIKSESANFNEAIGRFNLGKALFDNGRTEDAIREYNKTLSLMAEHPDDAMIADVSRHLGYAEMRRGNFDRAETDFLVALKHIRTWEHYAESVDDIFAYGLAESQRGHYKQGRAIFQVLLLKDEQEFMNLRPPPRLLREIGFDELHLRDYKGALKHLTEAYQEAEDIGDPEQLAYTCVSLAEYYIEAADGTKDLSESLKYAEKANQIFKSSLNDRVMAGAALTYEARVRIAMAPIYTKQGEYQAATTALRQADKDANEAYQTQKNAEREIGEAYSLQTLGLLGIAEQQPREALEHFRASYCVYRSMRSESIHMKEVIDSLKNFDVAMPDCSSFK